MIELTMDNKQHIIKSDGKQVGSLNITTNPDGKFNGDFTVSDPKTFFASDEAKKDFLQFFTDALEASKEASAINEN